MQMMTELLSHPVRVKQSVSERLLCLNLSHPMRARELKHLPDEHAVHPDDRRTPRGCVN
jgi:hypothetical protein